MSGPDAVTQAPRFGDFDSLLRHQAEWRAQQPALIDRDRILTYAALHEASLRVARGLRDAGIAKGDRVALWLPSIAAWLAVFLACARLGAIAVSVNTRFRSAELGDIVGRCGCKALVCWPGFRGIDFAGILAEVPRERLASLERVIAYEEGEKAVTALTGVSVVAYAELAAAPPLDGSAAGNAPCVIFTTSGTTRAPKFVLHDQATLLAHAHDTAEVFGYTAPGAAVLVTAPLCGVFGFCNALAALQAGSPLVMSPVFDAAEVARQIERYAITHANATNDAIAQILAQGGGVGRPYPSARVFGFASFAPGLDDVVADADRQGITLVGLYGSSELQALAARQPEDAPLAERRLAGGALVAREGKVRAVDPGTRAPLAHGVAGELEFDLPSRMLGYYGDEQASAAAFSPDGYFRSGDLGYTLSERRFVFLARIGDALRLGGFLVNPAEIEQVVAEVPGVRACQVVGVETPQGMRPVAFVVPRGTEGPDESAIIAHCQHRLAKFKAPVRVFAMESFPATAGANALKVQKHRLREIAEERMRQER